MPALPVSLTFFHLLLLHQVQPREVPLLCSDKSLDRMLATPRFALETVKTDNTWVAASKELHELSLRVQGC